MTQQFKLNKTLFGGAALFLSAVFLFSFFAPTAGAATISGLFNTGVLNDNTPAPYGSVDLHYTLISSPDANFPGPNAIVADPIAAGYWMANSSASRWIGPALNQGYPSGAASHAGGSYTYRISFDLTGFDPGTTLISGGWAADNSGTAILLNGISTGNPTGGYSSLAPFTLGSGFVAGINTLDFIVYNIPSGGSNPTGLRVEFQSATAAPVPAPAAAWLFGSGLLGLIGIGRRSIKRKQVR